MSDEIVRFELKKKKLQFVEPEEFARLRNSERRLAELQEAVRWERECEEFMDCGTARYIRRIQHHNAARAAVDALVGGEKG